MENIEGVFHIPARRCLRCGGLLTSSQAIQGRWTRNFTSPLMYVQPLKTPNARTILRQSKTASRNRGGGTCWCNPPYGRQIEAWVQKAAESNATVVMLLPARTDTAWFHDYIYGKAEIRFIRGRLKFGGSKNSAPFPSMVCIFRKER